VGAYGHLAMLPPGGAIHVNEEETLLDAVHRLARHILVLQR